MIYLCGARAKLVAPFTLIAYLQAFAPTSELRGEAGYHLTTCESACRFIMDLKLTQEMRERAALHKISSVIMM
jgi:hypothetical protein